MDDRNPIRASFTFSLALFLVRDSLNDRRIPLLGLNVPPFCDDRSCLELFYYPSWGAVGPPGLVGLDCIASSGGNEGWRY